MTEEQLGFRLIAVAILNQNIALQLACRFCHHEVQLIEVKQAGLGSELAFHFENTCDSQMSFPFCSQISAGNGEINSVNQHAAFATCCIGGDLAELRTFCGVMDLPPPLKKKFSQENY